MRRSLAAIALSTSFAGCLTYPSSSERFDDQIVVSAFAPGTEFGTFSTFAVAPNATLVDFTSGQSVTTTLDAAIGTPLTEAVEQQLSARGYQQVDPESDPDLGVNIAVIKATVDTFQYAPVWGYGGFAWGYYYPYFVPIYYDYDTTIVWVDLIDVRAADPPISADELVQLPSTWTALVYGVLENTVSSETAQAVQGIEQAFRQSPYLRAQP